MITKTEMSLDEALDTLTGYEERAIEERFEYPYEVLLVRKPTTAVRAVMYVLVARDLKAQDVKNPNDKAYIHVMESSVKTVTDFFPEVPEDDGEQPVTEPGKDAESDA